MSVYGSPSGDPDGLTLNAYANSELIVNCVSCGSDGTINAYDSSNVSVLVDNWDDYIVNIYDDTHVSIECREPNSCTSLNISFSNDSMNSELLLACDADSACNLFSSRVWVCVCTCVGVFCIHVFCYTHNIIETQ